MAARKDTVELCSQHIEELEALEKRRYNEKAGIDREDLLKTEPGAGSSGPRRPYGAPEEGRGGGNADRKALFEGASSGKKKKEDDPFKSNLPAIDDDTELVNEDFRRMNERNEQIVCFLALVDCHSIGRTMSCRISAGVSSSSRTLR